MNGWRTVGEWSMNGQRTDGEQTMNGWRTDTTDICRAPAVLFSLSAFGLCLALPCLPLHIHVQDLFMCGAHTVCSHYCSIPVLQDSTTYIHVPQQQCVLLRAELMSTAVALHAAHLRLAILSSNFCDRVFDSSFHLRVGCLC